MNYAEKTESIIRENIGNISFSSCMQFGSTSGTVVTGIAQCAGASSKTAFIAGISTASGIWLAGILTAIYCCAYNNEDDFRDNNCQNEASELSEADPLLDDISIDQTRTYNSDKSYSAATLTASYSATPQHVLSPYSTDEPKLDTIDTTLRC